MRLELTAALCLYFALAATICFSTERSAGSRVVEFKQVLPNWRPRYALIRGHFTLQVTLKVSVPPTVQKRCLPASMNSWHYIVPRTSCERRYRNRLGLKLLKNSNSKNPDEIPRTFVPVLFQLASDAVAKNEDSKVLQGRSQHAQNSVFQAAHGTPDRLPSPGCCC